jgi:ADP-ribose pyrophosphatase YjhB (NUDIX family)
MTVKKLTAVQIALWADRLRDLSALGLHFTKSFYDRERYQALQDLTLEMFAALNGEPVAELEPLRAAVFSRPTPFSAADAAVINTRGELLLIQRADNAKWAMPGGALEVGETPAQGALRETFEETGVQCAVSALVGVFDSRLCGSVTRHHLYHITFLCQPLDDQPPAEPSHGLETLGNAWFQEHALPEELDPGHASRIPIAFQVWRGEAPVFFDR